MDGSSDSLGQSRTGIFHAYIDDVVVHPDYRRRGIGKNFVLGLVAALTDVHEVTFFAGAENVPFYVGLGYKLRESQRVLHVRHPVA